MKIMVVTKNIHLKQQILIGAWSVPSAVCSMDTSMNKVRLLSWNLKLKKEKTHQTTTKSK